RGEGSVVLVNLRTWLDLRTGYKRFVGVMLLEHIPGGAKWRYVWGSCLAFVFFLQVFTGVLLMTAYSPGDSTAWGSVYFIQYEMEFGWLIRGLHHFGSQAMVVLLGLHMLQVVIAGAQLPPREVNWWLGLALMGAVLGLSLTGYLLPWDQKGFWATQVATNIAGNLPGAGAFLQRVVVGGPEYGPHTLARFYALHVGLLRPLVIALIVANIYVFRRHGVSHGLPLDLVTIPMDEKGGPIQDNHHGWFWPDQAFRDMVASMVIFGILLTLVLFGHGHKIESQTGESEVQPNLYERWAHAGRDGLGANLDAPADPGTESYPARPEWYFLFLFQLLKYFEGPMELVGTVAIPNGAGLLLFLLPLLGYGRMRKFGHVVGVLVVTALLAGAAALTLLALAEDTVYPLARETLVLAGTRLVPLLAGVFVIVLGLLAILPRNRFRSFVYASGVLLIAVLALGTGGLIYLAQEKNAEYARLDESAEQKTFAEKDLLSKVPQSPAPDTKEAKDAEVARQKKAADFQKSSLAAAKLAERAVNLARAGIPSEGAVLLLRRDPQPAGLAKFRQNCGSCHAYGPPDEEKPASQPTASDLKGFGSEQWILGLLLNPGDPKYFGRTKLTTMKDFIEEKFPNVALGEQ